MNDKEILNKIKRSITSTDPDAEIYLYGSRARGTHNIDSDYDILVITPRKSVTFEYELELRDSILDIEIETGVVISLMVYLKSDWNKKQFYSPLFINVSEEGIKI
ncbi:MAG: nucleotidyltransferase domain-containing protein [Bacteroidota bacterium]